MAKLVTHFCQFTDHPTALAQLSACTDGQSNWARPDILDPGVPVQVPAGSGTLKLGYFLNIALPALDASLLGLTEAGYRDATGNWVTVYGSAPAAAPQREFMPQWPGSPRTKSMPSMPRSNAYWVQVIAGGQGDRPSHASDAVINAEGKVVRMG